MVTIMTYAKFRLAILITDRDIVSQTGLVIPSCQNFRQKSIFALALFRYFSTYMDDVLKNNRDCYS